MDNENEKEPRVSFEEAETTEDKLKNPNSIGELLSLGKGLPTSPDKVYRSVKEKAAIDDIAASGVVRNKQSAGLVEKSRWGDTVFWSRGATGKFHAISDNGYVIEAPFSVAAEGVVRREDITAIYTRNQEGEIIDILKAERAQGALQREIRIEQLRQDTEEKLEEIRRGIEAVK